MKILCIYGCGGMGREIADLTSSMDKWEKIIFIDDNIKKRLVDGFPVLTLVETLNQFNKSDLDFIVATGEPSSREFIHKRIENYDLNIVNVTYPGFNLSRLSSIDIGTIVHSGTIITVNVHVGKGCLINKHVVIGHDVIIGDFTVISPNVTIGGNTNIESNCFFRKWLYYKEWYKYR
jgi:UDP-3-O-[3-hydroxymyristoyl] glucosamine N-acyltransferase